MFKRSTFVVSPFIVSTLQPSNPFHEPSQPFDTSMYHTRSQSKGSPGQSAQNRECPPQHQRPRNAPIPTSPKIHPSQARTPPSDPRFVYQTSIVADQTLPSSNSPSLTAGPSPLRQTSPRPSSPIPFYLQQRHLLPVQQLNIQQDVNHKHIARINDLKQQVDGMRNDPDAGAVDASHSYEATSADTSRKRTPLDLEDVGRSPESIQTRPLPDRSAYEAWLIDQLATSRRTVEDLQKKYDQLLASQQGSGSGMSVDGHSTARSREAHRRWARLAGHFSLFLDRNEAAVAPYQNGVHQQFLFDIRHLRKLIYDNAEEQSILNPDLPTHEGAFDSLSLCQPLPGNAALRREGTTYTPA